MKPVTSYYDSDGYCELGADLPHTFWRCNACGEQNSCEDGECQFCECGGLDCKRDSCSQPEHFHREHVYDGEVQDNCALCVSERDQRPPPSCRRLSDRRT